MYQLDYIYIYECYKMVVNCNSFESILDSSTLCVAIIMFIEVNSIVSILPLNYT